MVHRNELDAAAEAEFQRALVAMIPHMRAFARSLTGDATQADDLAQETVLKAWTNRTAFEIGSNLKAWLFMILRNQFYSDKRRSWRSVPLDPEVAERSLVANDDPSAALDLDDLRQALNRLPIPQREALILVGASGLSYEEAAVICGCAVGTVKSRVSRARVALDALLTSGDFTRDGAPAGDAGRKILAQADQIRRVARTGG
ncbi:sigma-70 family RNA polymerase sigma factor [Caulobacter sp. S45]|uniref:sigma-70 family RNA polymerase sigma factor n=1 Tax=Caulobacter sp. S45 TaxID=1641861 RepID=UPI00131D33E1|nr:sigma-70 family RNA polymerase sigma factor [Caulobacter sp. S45]